MRLAGTRTSDGAGNKKRVPSVNYNKINMTLTLIQCLKQTHTIIPKRVIPAVIMLPKGHQPLMVMKIQIFHPNEQSTNGFGLENLEFFPN